MLQFAASMLFCALLVMEPGLCRMWAREAMQDWALAVAPSLLPFFMAIPYLTSPEAQGVYRALLGWLPGLFGLPGEAAGAMVIGMLAGSPAGAAAQRNSGLGLSRSQALRLSVLCSGAGPVFYLSFVGDAMLGSAEAGRTLCLCQWAAGAITALLLRLVERDAAPAPRPEAALAQGNPVSRAVGQTLGIGGYMTLFAIAGGAAGLWLGPNFRGPAMALMELSGGARAMAAMPWPSALRLAALGAGCCFGGASICAQSLAHLRHAGVRTGEYLCGKWIQSLLDGLLIFAVCKL